MRKGLKDGEERDRRVAALEEKYTAALGEGGIIKSAEEARALVEGLGEHPRKKALEELVDRLRNNLRLLAAKGQKQRAVNLHLKVKPSLDLASTLADLVVAGLEGQKTSRRLLHDAGLVARFGQKHYYVHGGQITVSPGLECSCADCKEVSRTAEEGLLLCESLKPGLPE